MNDISKIIYIILSVILGGIGVYIAARVIAYAVATSWFQAKNYYNANIKNEEMKNGEKKEVK